ncbi:hypothetical protein CEXT_445991 [Caerostris extrusa]|uniref:Uncharacterized protein n=1 Tax=Caerostris extrusa TaxID=172846 RepID=A0AAV4UTX9_CAEEX|nr:hypothetical protein CEXT_445991 [Caerostris extrusa]
MTPPPEPTVFEVQGVADDVAVEVKKDPFEFGGEEVRQQRHGERGQSGTGRWPGDLNFCFLKDAVMIICNYILRSLRSSSLPYGVTSVIQSMKLIFAGLLFVKIYFPSEDSLSERRPL